MFVCFVWNLTLLISWNIFYSKSKQINITEYKVTSLTNFTFLDLIPLLFLSSEAKSYRMRTRIRSQFCQIISHQSCCFCRELSAYYTESLHKLTFLRHNKSNIIKSPNIFLCFFSCFYLWPSKTLAICMNFDATKLVIKKKEVTFRKITKSNVKVCCCFFLLNH